MTSGSHLTRDNPNDSAEDLDNYFGKVVTGPDAADPLNRDSISVHDRVCLAHPRFAEFAPPSIFDDPCWDDQYDIFWGYDGYVIDNCYVDLEQTIIPNLHCGQSNIIRRWRAADRSGNWSNIATQTITIINCKEWWVPSVCWRFTPGDVGSCDLVSVNGLTAYRHKRIEWPCDIELNRCQGPIAEVFKPENLAVLFDQDRAPRLDDDNCSLLAATYDDRVFTFVDSSCVKIFRDWEVIDWCLFEDFEAGIYFGEWKWEWTQVIKLLNSESPTFDNCEQTACGYGNPNDPNAAQCVGEVTIDPGIMDDCTRLNTLRIDYKVDLDDDGSYDELGYSTTYGNSYPFPNPNNLPVRRFEPEDYAIQGFYPVGTHRILWAVEDGCGNTNSCNYSLTIDDCKPPTAYCHVGVSTIPMPIQAGGYIDIWANDFDLDSYDNCTERDDLIFSFTADIDDRSIRRTCSDVTGVVENLTIYVWDEAGNYSTCDVGILLQDCGAQSQASISGSIKTEEGETIEEVMVHLNSNTPGMSNQELTGINGFFDFIDLPTGVNYEVVPEKDINPTNGVTTFDIVTISKHILGIQPLGSPYKMVAADVNKSGTITTFDILQIRKLILFIDTEFANNTSWRFVVSDFVYPNPDNPFATTFPENFSINGLSADLETDFVGIKIGDVNGSASPNSLVGSDDRSAADALVFEVANQSFEAEEEVKVDFRASDMTSVAGYQYSLGFDRDKLEFHQIVIGALEGLDSTNFGLTLLDEGVITTSWNTRRELEIANDAVLFSVIFTAKEVGTLADLLEINSSYTRAEGYDHAYNFLDMELEFTGNFSPAGPFALYQNQPNPFKNETMIGFNLSQAEFASLIIYDVKGKQLKVYEGEFAKGFNSISINRADFQGHNILYYELKTATNTASRKMIMIE